MKRLLDALHTILVTALAIVALGIWVGGMLGLWLWVGGMLWDFSEGLLVLIFVAIIVGLGVASYLIATVTWLVNGRKDKPPWYR